MNYIEPDVETIGIGLQASMGAMLLSSGAKGKRYCLPNSRIMIHQPSSGTEGKITDQEIMLKEGIFLKKRLAEIFAKNTGKDIKQVEKDMGRQAKSYNGVYSDRIIDIDLLMYDGEEIHTDTLQIPHPLISQRDFVKIPLQEVLDAK